MRRITANLPGRLEGALRRQAIEERYPCDSDYGVGLLLWDIYSRQKHNLTSPLLRGRRRELDQFVTELLADLRDPLAESPELKPYRYTVRVPDVLISLVKQRVEEEHYKSDSAYVLGLVLYSLKVRPPEDRRVAHHKTAPLMREPDRIKDAVIKQLAEDFGNPKRKWPEGFNGRIDELLIQQRQLPL